MSSWILIFGGGAFTVFTVAWLNYINPGSQIPQVEARKRCSRDLFTSSGRATALIDRHFWYTFPQQSMTRLTNTTILLTYASRFHWRFSGNWQEHICERNIRCFGSPGHPSRWVEWPVKCDSMPNLHCAVVGCTADSRKLKLLEKYPWMAGVTFIKFSTSLFHRRIWYNLLRRGGPNDRMTAENIGKWQRVCSQHFVDGRPAPQHPHPMLFDYNNFKVSKSPRTLAWISNHTHYKVWDKVTYPFLNFNCWSLGMD